MNSEIDQLLHRCRAWLFRTLANPLFDPYRPELHYMRGPGPKWRAKYRTLLGELMDETHMTAASRGFG